MSNNHKTDVRFDYTRDTLSELIARSRGPDKVPRRFKIITDTTDFFRVDYNDVVILADRPYLIHNCEKEGRFGLDDEPKYWVKRATDLLDNSSKIIKLVFHETITAKVGEIVFQCVRSPRKEGAILDLVREHASFMHGFSVADEAGNLIRILDYIIGRRFDDLVNTLNTDHEVYFHEHLPGLLQTFTELIRAIKFIHDHGYKHGDIRRDHILIDKRSGVFRWIDFDYDYMHQASMFSYDLFGLGNILIFLVGGGDVTVQQLMAEGSPVLDRLADDDFNIVFQNRVANLQKVYPYLPDELAFVLRHFSKGANLFYETADQLIDDLQEVVME